MADGKMSKSVGNVVYADDLVEKYGVDAVRYYLLHEIPFSSDGTFTYELLVESINSNLANVLGNLVNRTIGMANKYFDGIITKSGVADHIDNELKELVLGTKKIVDSKMNELKIADSLDAVFEIFRRCNKYIDETMPWVLAKDETKQERLQEVLYNLVESIRIGAVLLQAYLPDTSSKIFEQLNTNNISFDTLDKFGYYESGTKLNDAQVLFMRIDTKSN
jgi:methionyl-tRNA synthetase